MKLPIKKLTAAAFAAGLSVSVSFTAAAEDGFGPGYDLYPEETQAEGGQEENGQGEGQPEEGQTTGEQTGEGTGEQTGENQTGTGTGGSGQAQAVQYPEGMVQVDGDASVEGNAWVGGNARVKGPRDIYWISCIGSRDGTTTFFRNANNGISVSCGCFYGTIDEFAAAVTKTHGDNEHAQAYRHAIEIAKLRIKLTDAES